LDSERLISSPFAGCEAPTLDIVASLGAMNARDGSVCSASGRLFALWMCRDFLEGQTGATARAVADSDQEEPVFPNRSLPIKMTFA
jgi:hypothetical protein